MPRYRTAEQFNRRVAIHNSNEFYYRATLC